jgi:hypothetical protein
VAGLVEADAVVDAEPDDWLCAASSACIVAGEICERRPLNPLVPVEPVEVSPKLGSSNPVEVADDVVEEASDWSALTAVDAAPKANSMVTLRYMPPKAAQPYTPVTSASAMPLQKAQ